MTIILICSTSSSEYEMRACRRQGPDLLLRSLRYIALVGWVIMMAALLILGQAKPQVETFFERIYNIRLRSHWDLELAYVIYLLLLAGLAIGLVGLTINFFRHRRRDDEWWYSLILLALASLSGILLYLKSF